MFRMIKRSLGIFACFCLFAARSVLIEFYQKGSKLVIYRFLEWAVFGCTTPMSLIQCSEPFSYLVQRVLGTFSWLLVILGANDLVIVYIKALPQSITFIVRLILMKFQQFILSSKGAIAFSQPMLVSFKGRLGAKHQKLNNFRL